MNMVYKKFTHSLVFAVIAATVQSCLALANTLPEGSYKGNSNLVGKGLWNNDVMALLIKQDPSNKDVYYAILAEYDRIPLTNFTRKTAITKWVPRIYAYRVDKVDDLTFSMKPLMVTNSGEIEVNALVKADQLLLKKPNSLRGAIITRYNKQSDKEVVEETIKFRGKVGSTWEDYVAGTYYGTKRKSGKDYFKKDINMDLSEDKVATFYQDEIKGKFTISEKLPGLFTFTATSEDNAGNDKVTNKIGLFIDIVNWKPIATTEELILINTDDATDVGFYYERH